VATTFTKITKSGGNTISKEDTSMILGPDNNIYLLGCDGVMQSTMYNYITQTWTDLPDWEGIPDTDFVLNGISYIPDPSHIAIVNGYTVDTYIPEYDEHIFSFHLVFLKFDVSRHLWQSNDDVFYRKMIYSTPPEIGYGIFPHRQVMVLWGSLLNDVNYGIFIQSEMAIFDAPRDKGVPSLSNVVLPYDFSFGNTTKLDFVTTFLNHSTVTITIPYINGYIEWGTSEDVDFIPRWLPIIESYVNVCVTIHGGGGN
jgi:hypothetical protein